MIPRFFVFFLLGTPWKLLKHPTLRTTAVVKNWGNVLDMKIEELVYKHCRQLVLV